MTINYTTLLGLAQPVTGTEAGTWGDTVNDAITALVEEAIAGGESISVTAGDVTLTDTAGQANQARNAILILTGTPGVSRNVIAPSTSKVYVVVNNSNAAVVIKGAATTGVTIAAGGKSLVAWNGSDFVEIGQAGDVDGPTSATANAVPTYDGTTGKLIKDNSGVTIASNIITASGFSGPLNGSVGASTPSTGVFTQVDITAQGDLRLQDTTGGEYVALHAPAALASSYTLTLPVDDGTSGQVLTTDGSGVLSWTTDAGGDVDGPASATDNAIARFDGTTGKLIQNSAVTVADTTGDIVSSGALSLGTNLTFTGTGNRITGDFSNATIANRVAIQTSTTNGNTSLTALPNGTGKRSQFEAYDNSDPTNAAFIQIVADSASVPAFTAIQSGIRGTGTYLPMTFYTGGSERMRIDTSGNVGIGTNSPTVRLSLGTNTPAGTASKLRLFDDGAAETSTTSNSYGFGISAAGQFSYTAGTSGLHAWFTANTERMRIDSSGNVGIGTTTPATILNAYNATSAIISVDGDLSTSFRASRYSTDAVAPSVALRKARGTLASPSAINNSDIVGILNMQAYGGSNFRQVGRVDTIVETYTSDTNISSALRFWTNSGSTDVTERMRITAAGNVGIGTSSPVAKLQSAGAAATTTPTGGSATGSGLYINNTDTTFGMMFGIGGGGDGWIQQQRSDSTNTQYNLLLQPIGGNVLIGGTAARGTTAGAAHLDIFNGTAPAGTLTNGISLYSSSGDFNFMDSAGNGYKVGFRNIPPVGTKTGSYTLATGDVGKYVQVGSGGSITIPDATFAEGDVVSIFNNTTGNITITCTITTAYIAGTDSDKASVTLATRGVATILFISSTVCVISGNVS